MRIPVMVERARACTICEGLPLGPRPLVQGSGRSRVLLIGQAPGKVTHERGLPWDDASGDRLRAWLGVSRERFYDPRVFAHMPMGFCYPGKGGGGDLPPRAECAPEWHPKLLRVFRRVELTILIGTYAMKRYEPELAKGSVTDAVRAWERTWRAQRRRPIGSWRWWARIGIHEIRAARLTAACLRLRALSSMSACSASYVLCARKRTAVESVELEAKAEMPGTKGR